jgi:bacterioferritin
VADIEKEKVIALLNRILERELAGVVRYTHYSFLVFGFGRIPLVSWLRDQANESLAHAQQAGEWITTLGAYPSLAIGPLLDSHRHDTGVILRESLAEEAQALALYRELLALEGALGGAGRVRAADDSCGRGARGGRRQDAAEARRAIGLCAARGVTCHLSSSGSGRIPLAYRSPWTSV